MTIAVAVKTSSAIIFAADSKVTTLGIAGIEQNGSPRMVEQTYDNATKVAHDRSKGLMAIVAGHANIGRVGAIDLISSKSFPVIFGETASDQDRRIRDLVIELVAQKRAYWETTNLAPDQWPGPTLLLAAPGPADSAPRLWRVDLSGPDSAVEELLKDNPGIRLEGSYASAFTLLYGYDLDVLHGVGVNLAKKPEEVSDALGKLAVLKPLDKLNLWAIPTQDAIDLAVFLAHVQEQMDRFLPGTPRCGGPIDVLVLQTAPEPGILTFPGKALRHPGGTATMGLHS